VHNELGLHCMAHNLKKMHNKQQAQRAELAQNMRKLAVI
jgi:hypothetical protein